MVALLGLRQEIQKNEKYAMDVLIKKSKHYRIVSEIQNSEVCESCLI